MSDPVTLSLASVGTVALQEGVKFLYGQAADILRRRRRVGEKERGQQSDGSTTIEVAPPQNAIEGGPFVANLDGEALETLRGEIELLVKDLAPYAAEGQRPAGNPTALRKIHALRLVLERIYGHPLVFFGEERQQNTVRSSVDIGTIAGYVAAVRGDPSKINSNIDASVRGESVTTSGRLIGVDLRGDQQ